MLHLQEIISGSLDVLADIVPVRRAVQQRAQDEHVKRALNQVRSLLYLLDHGRPSTLNDERMVDARLSPVKRCRIWQILK